MNTGDIIRLATLALTVLGSAVGIVVYFWHSQNGQNGHIRDNRERVGVLEDARKQERETIRQFAEGMSTLAEKMGEVQVALGRVETMSANQGEDIRELKDALRRSE